MTLKEKLKQELNDQQFRAATHVNGPAVIMAGAGSGKTHTLMSRVSYLIDSGVIPERILMLTFTNAAADEMKDRASRLLDDRCSKIVACTYHKFCNQILRQFGSRINIKEYSILSYPETKNMVDYVKSSDAIFDNLKGFPSAGMVADIMSVSINKQVPIREILMRSDKYSKYRDYWQEIQYLSDKVIGYGRRTGQLTYDDLLVYMNELLQDNETCRQVANRFDYIMVDEFQDTNNLQEQMIISLSEYNNNIVVVGDISQSIYAFRGANVKNLQNFNKKLENCEIMPLTYNYRSTQEILNLANDVMQKNARSWKYYNMHSPDKKGNIPRVIQDRDAFAEVDDVMKLIHFYHDEKNIPYSEIAILIRGSMQSFGVENELANDGIKFIKMGGPKFMDLDAVGDMLALCNIVVNPHNLLAWYRVLQLHPLIGKKYSKALSDECGRLDFLLENQYKNRKFYSELQTLSSHYDMWKRHHTLAELLDQLETYYFNTRLRACEESRMKDESKEEEYASIENDRGVVAVLKMMASKYDDVVSFVDDIVLDSTSKEEPDDDTLTISTIHSAKGLEWEVVIIMDAIEGVFPKIKREDWYSEEDEEELRCFYVAATRAKRYLNIFAPKYIQTYMGMDKAELSHYLQRSQNAYRWIARDKS